MKPKGKSVFYPVKASEMFDFYQPMTLGCQTQMLKVIGNFLKEDKKPAILIIGGECGNGKTHLIYYSCEEFTKSNPHIGIYRHQNNYLSAELFCDLPEDTKYLFCDGNLWHKNPALNSVEITKILNRRISLIVEVANSDLLLEKIDFSSIDFIHTKIKNPSYLDKISFFYYTFKKFLNRKPMFWDVFEIIKNTYRLNSLRGLEGGIRRIKLREDLLKDSKSEK